MKSVNNNNKGKGVTKISSPSQTKKSLRVWNPFTKVQLREFERQIMIYKHLVAGVSVPFYHLSSIPTSARSNITDPMAASSSTNADSMEGRCRRTDGKTWRCSGYVAPKNKYCDRHMYRNTHRSRKSAGLCNKDKRSYLSHFLPSTSSHPYLLPSVSVDNRSSCVNCNKDERSYLSHFLPSTSSHPYLLPSVSVDNRSSCVNCNKDKRSYLSHFLPSTSSHPYLLPSVSVDNRSSCVKMAPRIDHSNKQPRMLMNGNPMSLAASNSGWNNNIPVNQYPTSLPQYNSTLVYNPSLVPPTSEKTKGNNSNSSIAVENLSFSSLDPYSMMGPLGEILWQRKVTSNADESITKSGT